MRRAWRTIANDRRLEVSVDFRMTGVAIAGDADHDFRDERRSSEAREAPAFGGFGWAGPQPYGAERRLGTLQRPAPRSRPMAAAACPTTGCFLTSSEVPVVGQAAPTTWTALTQGLGSRAASRLRARRAIGFRASPLFFDGAIFGPSAGSDVPSGGQDAGLPLRQASSSARSRMIGKTLVCSPLASVSTVRISRLPEIPVCICERTSTTYV